MTDWQTFGLRQAAGLSGRTKVVELPPFLQDLADGGLAAAAQPLLGISDGTGIRPQLFSLGGRGAPTAPIVEAANEFLSGLDEAQQGRVLLPLDSEDRRLWFNIHPNVFRHGLLLEDLDDGRRQAAMKVMATTLSSRGFQQARDIMRLNGLLIEITKRADEFGEWPYWFSLFGNPSADQPWAWQIDGHHLNLNCLVIGDQMVLTPSFMGSEPCRVASGRLAGTEVLVPEERSGLDLIRSLDDDQLATAVLRPSIEPGELPTDLKDPVDGRMQAGAFKDNAVIAPDGVRGDAMTEAQRRLLANLIGTYVGWARNDHAEVRMNEASAHLDETSFCWMGSTGDNGPFYYRVQSPVVLIEFDHHPGVVFDNLVPTQNHIHSILRTPNGGDYGADLLRQHYERFDHSDGHHHPR